MAASSPDRGALGKKILFDVIAMCLPKNGTT